LGFLWFSREWQNAAQAASPTGGEKLVIFLQGFVDGQITNARHINLEFGMAQLPS
jgi:hypothetical protein